jgi:hypothetical protein
VSQISNLTVVSSRHTVCVKKAAETQGAHRLFPPLIISGPMNHVPQNIIRDKREKNIEITN